MITNASFTLEDYKFSEVMMNLANIQPGSNKFNLSITPEGVFSAKDSTFLLKFRFQAFLSEDERSCIDIVCVGTFRFTDAVSLEDIPSYFYSNCIAILFPYVRAFVSTVTLQANYKPIVIPTMNLSGLSEELQSKVTVVE